MSTAENKEIVRRRWYQDLWDNWNLSTADDLFTSDYRLHLPGIPTSMDREATKAVVKMFSASFPDLQHTIDEMIAEGNAVAARWTIRGTHRGDFQGIPATGQSVKLSGTTVHHLADGKIAETWLTFDNLQLLQQLGVTPQPTQ
jgi:steroid delta-isomerase-like uncharacterized protein